MLVTYSNRPCIQHTEQYPPTMHMRQAGINGRLFSFSVICASCTMIPKTNHTAIEQAVSVCQGSAIFSLIEKNIPKATKIAITRKRDTFPNFRAIVSVPKPNNDVVNKQGKNHSGRLYLITSGFEFPYSITQTFFTGSHSTIDDSDGITMLPIQKIQMLISEKKKYGITIVRTFFRRKLPNLSV